MHTATHTIERDGQQIDIEVEYTVAPFYPAQTYGPAEDCYPSEGGEIEELTAYLDGEAIKLTPDETRKIEAHIYDRHDYDEWN